MKLTEDNIKKVIDKLNEDSKGGIKCPLYAENIYGSLIRS